MNYMTNIMWFSVVFALLLSFVAASDSIQGAEKCDIMYLVLLFEARSSLHPVIFPMLLQHRVPLDCLVVITDSELSGEDNYVLYPYIQRGLIVYNKQDATIGCDAKFLDFDDAECTLVTCAMQLVQAKFDPEFLVMWEDDVLPGLDFHEYFSFAAEIMRIDNTVACASGANLNGATSAESTSILRSSHFQSHGVMIPTRVLPLFYSMTCERCKNSPRFLSRLVDRRLPAWSAIMSEYLTVRLRVDCIVPELSRTLHVPYDTKLLLYHAQVALQMQSITTQWGDPNRIKKAAYDRKLVNYILDNCKSLEPEARNLGPLRVSKATQPWSLDWNATVYDLELAESANVHNVYEGTLWLPFGSGDDSHVLIIAKYSKFYNMVSSPANCTLAYAEKHNLVKAEQPLILPPTVSSGKIVAPYWPVHHPLLSAEPLGPVAKTPCDIVYSIGTMDRFPYANMVVSLLLHQGVSPHCIIVVDNSKAPAVSFSSAYPINYKRAEDHCTFPGRDQIKKYCDEAGDTASTLKQCTHIALQNYDYWCYLQLTATFANDQQSNRVVVLEDDLMLSPDFVHVMKFGSTVLDVDPTIAIFSSWTDNPCCSDFDPTYIVPIKQKEKTGEESDTDIDDAAEDLDSSREEGLMEEALVEEDVEVEVAIDETTPPPPLPVRKVYPPNLSTPEQFFRATHFMGLGWMTTPDFIVSYLPVLQLRATEINPKKQLRWTTATLPWDRILHEFLVAKNMSSVFPAVPRVLHLVHSKAIQMRFMKAPASAMLKPVLPLPEVLRADRYSKFIEGFIQQYALWTEPKRVYVANATSPGDVEGWWHIGEQFTLNEKVGMDSMRGAYDGVVFVQHRPDDLIMLIARYSPYMPIYERLVHKKFPMPPPPPVLPTKAEVKALKRQQRLLKHSLLGAIIGLCIVLLILARTLFCPNRLNCLCGPVFRFLEWGDATLSRLFDPQDTKKDDDAGFARLEGTVQQDSLPNGLESGIGQRKVIANLRARELRQERDRATHRQDSLEDDEQPVPFKPRRTPASRATKRVRKGPNADNDKKYTQ